MLKFVICYLFFSKFFDIDLDLDIRYKYSMMLKIVIFDLSV